MTCAKLEVRCTLVTANGEYVVGTNACANPQPACPREPGEGYEKCTTICHQAGHAEEVALARLLKTGATAEGAHAYVEGHTHACRACQEQLYAAGITAVTMGPPPSLKELALQHLRAAERLMYRYAGECDVGRERERAFDVYANIRTATRV